MTDERAKEIAEMLRLKLNVTTVARTDIATDDVIGFAVKLYDDIQTLKAAAAATSFLHAGIQPVRKIDG